MDNWSDKYLSIPWLWRGAATSGCDCLGLVKIILSNEVHIDMKELTPEDINSNYNMIERAIQYGEVIRDKNMLKEFDIVFFNIRGEVTHMGIMVDKFGRFLHQLENKVSRVSHLNSPYWEKRFFTGIRLNELSR
jgi:cell wall-associated NlpC family hydrolase